MRTRNQQFVTKYEFFCYYAWLYIASVDGGKHELHHTGLMTNAENPHSEFCTKS